MTLLPGKKKLVKGLHLSRQATDEILSRMDDAASRYHGAENRREDRLPFRPVGGLGVRLIQGQGTHVDLLVVPRNISQNGLAFLHGNYVHLSNQCVVNLQNAYGEVREIRGVVVRCAHVSGQVHEVGVQFNEPLLDANDFISSEAAPEESATPAPPPVQLSGKVLYVEDSSADRELASFMLTKRGVELITVENPAEALKRDDIMQFDAVMTDCNLPDMTGPELTEAIRAKGYSAPIIAVTAEDGDQMRKTALEKGCTHVLTKPYSFDDLFRILETYLRVKGGGADAHAVLSSNWDDVTMRPLILRYLEWLEKQVHEISTLMTNEDRAHLQDVCNQIKGSARGYGYNQISRAALEANRLATAGMSFDEIRVKTDELVRLCNAACRVRDDADS